MPESLFAFVVISLFSFFFPTIILSITYPQKLYIKGYQLLFSTSGLDKYLDYIFVVAIHCRGDSKQSTPEGNHGEKGRNAV